MAFPRDRPYLKFLVYVNFALEMLQTIFTMKDTFVIFVTDLGKFQQPGRFVLSGSPRRFSVGSVSTLESSERHMP
jgi:hypothetical protein